MTSLLMKSIKSILNYRSSIGQASVKYIGQDYLGNKYFEAERPNHSTRKRQRYFETKDQIQSFDQLVSSAHVPPAWDAWLRFKKSDPPTEAEVQESVEYFKFQQELAAKKKLEGIDLDYKRDRGTYLERKEKLPKHLSREPKEFSDKSNQPTGQSQKPSSNVT